jgi:6-phosphogluconolactonase
MLGYLNKIAMAVMFAAISLSWTSCGGGSTQHPCQGTTCVQSARTFLYLSALDDISGFDIATSGTPTSFQNVSGPNQSIGIVADPSAKFLYVSDFGNAAVHAFTINSSTGVLSSVSGSPFSAGSPPDAGGIAIDPNTKFLYVTLMNSGAVAGFSINATTGALTSIAGSPFPAGNAPVQAIVDSSGKFLYVSNLNDSQGSISAYNIDPTSGVLTPIPGSPFPTQTNFPGPAGLAIGGDGKFLYVGMAGTATANNVISGFSIASNSGVLTQLTGSPFTAGNSPLGLATDSTGKFLFAANGQDDTLSAFSIDLSSGALAPVLGSPFATHTAPVAVALDPAGQFVYVANSGSGDLSAFSLDSTTGGLTPLPGAPFSTGQLEPGGLVIVKAQ